MFDKKKYQLYFTGLLKPLYSIYYISSSKHIMNELLIYRVLEMQKILTTVINEFNEVSIYLDADYIDNNFHKLMMMRDYLIKIQRALKTFPRIVGILGMPKRIVASERLRKVLNDISGSFYSVFDKKSDDINYHLEYLESKYFINFLTNIKR